MSEAQLSGMLERDDEIAHLLAAVGDVCGGDGRLLVIEGPSGIGKTELLREARRLAREAGMTVLNARGGEFERDFPFGVVRQLLEPVLVQAGPEDRAHLLAGAAELAAGLLDPAGPPPQAPSADPSYQALHGLYWLVVNLTTLRGPTAAVVDDIQWADGASLRFLAFLARRTEEIPALVCVGLRAGEPGMDAARVGELIRGPLARSLRPAPLSGHAVHQLVAARLGAHAEPGFSEACRHVTGGNPSLVRELLVALADEDIEPVDAEAERVRQVGPEAISQSVLLRLATEPADVLALAKAVAVLGDGTELEAAGDLAGLSTSAALSAADTLAAREVLEARTPLEFAHPVLRAAVYQSLQPGERSRLHREAARVVRERGGGLGAVAAHLLLTDPGRDPEVAAALREAGASALAQGAPQAAVAYLRRALREPVETAGRARVLRELGTAEARAGLPEAIGTLKLAVDTAEEPAERAAAALECGRALMIAGRGPEGVELLEEVIAGLHGEWPELAGMLEAEQLMCAHTFRSVRERLLAHLDAFAGSSDGSPSVAARVLLAIAAIEEATSGDSCERAAAHAQRALGDGEMLAALGPESPPYWQAVCALALADHAEAAAREAATALDAARGMGSAHGFAIASSVGGWIALLRGALDEAEADVRQALTVESDTWQLVRPMAVGTLIEVLIERGRLDEAEVIAGGAPVAGPPAGAVLQEIAIGARGRLFAALGRHRQALECFDDVARRQEAWGARTPSIFPWRSSAALSHLALGDRARAAGLATDELERARAYGSARMEGMAVRICGLVGDGPQQIECLTEAVSVLEGSVARLEHARALVDLGAALRRQNKRMQARDLLRLGLDVAHRCRADVLCERAREELRAAGARPRRALLTGSDALTASERRVATMAVDGLSNKAIAQALFVTLGTVEFHLGNAYRKLGISSRGELADALERQQPTDEPAQSH